MKRVSCAVAAAALLASLTCLPAGAETGDVTVIASGLNAPRHLSFAPNGDLYVAESGAPSADAGPCAVHPEFGDVCLAATGSVTKIGRNGTQSRVLTGLPSLVSADEATGPSDVIVHGNTLTVSIGLGGTPELRASLGKGGAMLGTVIDAKLTGRGATLSVRADIAAFEAAHDPDGAGVDSNVVDVAFAGRDLVAVDAGGNTVVAVGKKGGMDLVATLPVIQVSPAPFPGAPDPFPAQSVPTAATLGPDGAWYVSELTGFPFKPGTSTVWRIADGVRTAFATGLTNVTDLAFDGSQLYVVQIADGGLMAGPVGSLVAVHADGEHQTVVDELFAPYGLAIRDGAAYVTTGSVLPGGGQVIRVEL